MEEKLGSINFWAILAGLGIFLMGMILIEKALEQLAGRTFKRFLRQFTNHPIKAVLGGILVTVILQSSSLVSLMVLAFVGAGIIELRNAIGIIIGSNLGTTFTGWIVAYFGFSFQIDQFAMPLIAIGALGMVFFENRARWYQMTSFLVGIGFLFLGLEYMKSGIEMLGQNFDLAPFVDHGPYLLFVVGFVLTAIIQSSSASMVITLSALNAGLIPIEAAAAMVIGNDLGTTITVMLGGIKGSPAKKRVALSHFLFNLIVDLIALALLFPLLKLVTSLPALSNPLLQLVAFHSTFNLMGIFIFLPFLKYFARFLERRFKRDDSLIAKYIAHVPPEVPEVAIEALQKEICHLIDRVFYLNISILELDKTPFLQEELPVIKELNVSEQYELIKELEGEITAYYLLVQNEPLTTEETDQLNQLIAGIRYAMTAAKEMKDINHNLQDFRRSVNDDLIQLMELQGNQQQLLLLNLYLQLKGSYETSRIERLADHKRESKRYYNQFLEKAYPAIRKRRFSEVEISTMFNVNREIHQSNKAMIQALKSLLLTSVQAKDFDLLLGNN